MTFTPYSKNKSIGIPEGNTMSVAEYNKAVKAKKGRNKYNAKSCQYNGYNYDSKLEASYAQELDYRLQLGEIESWERQVRLDLFVKEKLWRSYKIDFKIHHFNSPPEYVEVKGVQTDEWRQKWDLLKIIRDDVLEPKALLTLQFKTKRYQH